MLRKLLTVFVSFLILLSCSYSKKDSRLGTGKPKFASLEIEGMLYDFSSENGSFVSGEDLKLMLKVTNISQNVKSFKSEKKQLLVLLVKNEFRENLQTVEIPYGNYINGDSFNLNPGEVKIFPILLDTKNDIYNTNNSVYCSIRLLFLPKQFRRNTLSIYVEKK